VDPNEFLARMVEVKGEVLARGTTCNSLITGELNLLNQILMRNLGEPTTLIGIKVDVINIKTASTRGKRRRASNICNIQ